jgi:hypothetical protein
VDEQIHVLVTLAGIKESGFYATPFIRCIRAGLDAVAKVVLVVVVVVIVVVVVVTFRNPKVGSRDLSFLCAFAKQL